MRGLDVAVIGCGSAGPAAAILLQRAGHRVTVFEAVPAFGPVGAGVLLQPTGLDVLGRLDILAPILAHGAPVTRLVCHTRGGARVLDLAYGELGPAVHGVGIHRAVLLHYLVEAVRAAGIPIHLGTPIEEVIPAGPAGPAGSTGTAGRAASLLRDRDGVEHGPFGLVVVADGARSPLRTRLQMRARVARYPWGALWFIGKDPEQRFAHRLSQTVHGARHMIGILPTGLDIERSAPLVSLFHSVRLADADDVRRAGLDAWKAGVRALAPQAEPILAQIHDFEQLALAAYFDVVMRPWHDGHVVFLGDAAHATSPQLGQGVNLALCDAAALADGLAESGDVPAALAAYTRRRAHHLAYYQRASRWLTPFFQSSSRVLGWLRDLGLGAMTRLAPFRRKMIRTMAGLERGFVRRGLPAPALPLLPPDTRAQP
jgi:2-polyprenyl-6-methoxyphenol hydroxylase-like FAD-dependent oxidoreductase